MNAVELRNRFRGTKENAIQLWEIAGFQPLERYMVDEGCMVIFAEVAKKVNVITVCFDILNENLPDANCHVCTDDELQELWDSADFFYNSLRS